MQDVRKIKQYKGMSEKCYIEEEIYDYNSGAKQIVDTYYIDDKNKISMYRSTDNIDIIFFNYETKSFMKDAIETSSQLLSYHLWYYTKSGMNPDELIFILNNHENYENIKYVKNVNRISNLIKNYKNFYNIN